MVTINCFVTLLALSSIAKVSAKENFWILQPVFIGVVVACSSIAIVIGVCCCCTCMRKSSQGRVLNPTQDNSVPLVNQQAYPCASYYAQHPNNRVIVYPPENYATQSTAQYNTQSEYNTQPQYNTQPEYNTQHQYETQPQFDTQPQYDIQPRYQSSETSGWHETEKQLSAPPPSYDEVMK